MDHDFTVFIDRLTEGKTQSIDEKVLKDFFFEDEEALKFAPEVLVKGKAYLTNDHLVLDIEVKTEASMPCIICEKFVPFSLEIEKQTLTIPLEEIKSKIFSYKDLIKEGILLQLPQTKECNDGCSLREEISSYMKKQNNDVTTHFPFSGIEE